MWWRKPRDILTSVLVATGKRIPAVFRLYLRLGEGWDGGPCYIVYSTGASGTGSVLKALRKCGARPLLHTHNLSVERLESTGHYPRGVGWIYRKTFVEAHRPMRIVSMVRNPVDRCVSNFFAQLDPGEYDLQALTQMMVEYSRQWVDSDWFEDEMNVALGIDVYATEFPAQDGHVRIDSGNWSVLLLRLELDDERKAEILRQFAGFPELTLHKSNETKSKATGTLYRRFRDEAQLPQQCLDGLLNTRYGRHFFSDEERAACRARWSRQLETVDV